MSAFIPTPILIAFRCVLGCLVLLAVDVQADYQVALLLPNSQHPYRQVSTTLQAELAYAGDAIKLSRFVLDKSGLPDAKVLAGYDLLIPVGFQATEWLVAKQLNTKTLSIFITHDAFEEINRRHPLSTGRRHAIVLDQPASRLVGLVQQLPLTINRLAMLQGTGDEARYQAIMASGAARDIAVISRHLRSDENPVKKIKTLMASNDAFLVLPGSAAYNRRISRWIIHLSYRYKIPVIAYSKRYAEAGALVAVFSTPEQIAVQAAEQTQAILAGVEPIQQIIPPAYFSVRVNDAVRRSLKLPPLDERELIDRLKAAQQHSVKGIDRE